MTKRETFLQASKAVKAKKAALYEREPERKLYDEGKIGWKEYVKLAAARKN